MIQVDVLYFEGCPHHEPALKLVRNVIHELGITAEVREVDVETAEDAVRLRFLGSPTIHVDGVDIEPARTNDTTFGMSCRRYDESGVPPRGMLVTALRERAA